MEHNHPRQECLRITSILSEKKMNVIEIKNLSVDFFVEGKPVNAVKNSSLSIKEGETFGLVGESGSGKSVTSLAIMGLLPKPQAKVPNGEILYKGKNILDFTTKEMTQLRGNKITMIFQEPMTSLNPVFKIGNQIIETIILHQDVSKKEAREKAIQLLEEVGIPDPSRKVDDYPHQLSGGQRQRVMIAMALACEPDLMICDEPTTALDVTIQKQVLELLVSLKKNHKMSLLFISHDLSVVAEIADRVAVMKHGVIVEQGKTEDLFLRPNHPYTKGLLACRPSLGDNPKRLPTVQDFLSKEDPSFSFPKEKIEIKIEKNIEENKNPILLEVKNCTKYFPIKGGLFGRTIDNFKAVDNVSFTLKKGMTLGLVGESGSGKTTLGRTILHLTEPTSGEIIYRGQNLSNLSSKEMRSMRKKLQIIFQDPYSSLNPRMTVGEIITEPLHIHKIGKDKKERKEIAHRLLKKVGLLPEHYSRYPHEFSGGQRQRICIARTLTVKPEFIICDESVSALDVSIQAQVLNLLQDLQEEFDLTYIFISHDLNVVKYFSDQIAVMKEGKIVEMASPSEIYKNPSKDYTKRLIDSIPKGISKEASL